MKTFSLVWLAATVAAGAQQLSEKNVVRASAEASVTAQPDRAHISIGVRTQAPTAKEAAEQNATKTAAVLKTMKDVIDGKGQVQTAGYSISPHYETTGATNRQDGYECGNTVEVTVDDLSLVPKVIDTASANGANSVGGISFGLKDDTVPRLEALKEATKKARVAAETMAQALNLQVMGVANAESSAGVSPIRPMMQNFAMASRVALPTPIEAGTLDIHASATVTLEVSH